tara:strand:- start:10 stop:123 length:114 start_codon:yes stop_codon:yes gene_type:complete
MKDVETFIVNTGQDEEQELERNGEVKDKFAKRKEMEK